MIFGVETVKKSAINADFRNRYFVEAESVSDAALLGEILANIERPMFGNGVLFHKVHAYELQPNFRQFYNLALNFNGSAPDLGRPIKSEIVLRFELFGQANYPQYKDYRVQIASDHIEGVRWDSEASQVFQQQVAAFGAQGNFLRTREGQPVISVNYQTEYQFRQNSKRWYNRKP